MTARVLHVITRLEPGGAQRNTLYTVGHLDRRRFAAALAWGPGDPLDEAAARLADVTRIPIDDLVRRIAPRRDLAALRALRSAIRSFEPAIVHTHSSKAGILGRLAARLEGTPVVVHSIHGFGFTPLQSPLKRALFFAAEKCASRFTDHFIAVARNNLELGLRSGLFDASRVSLIRSGIDLGRAAGGDGLAVREEFGIDAATPMVLQIGNFKPQKAPLDFVNMAHLVHRRVPAAHFVMVGEGRLRPAAEHLAAELGIGDSITFCGWRDDVPDLLDAASVSVLSSRHEGLPRAVVESLAAGVPVVATRVDGTAEVVRHGVNGVLTDPGDVAGLAAGVCELLQDPSVHHRFAAAAPTDLGEFDIDLMVRQQEALYETLLGARDCARHRDQA